MMYLSGSDSAYGQSWSAPIEVSLLEQVDAKECDVWQDDLLDRRAEARFLIDFLSRRSKELAENGQAKSFVLNINAEWGQGKTFFLKRLDEQLAAESYVSVYINAWTDDHAPDPLVAVIAALDRALQPFMKKKNGIKKLWDTAKASGLEIVITAAALGVKNVTKHAVKKMFGEEGGETLSAVANATQKVNQKSPDELEAATEEIIDKLIKDDYARNLLNNFNKTKSSINAFKYNLTHLAAALLNDKKLLPLFIIIDELDRCRPTYAIELLERIKHLFDVPNVVFVVATDTEQLGCSIKAVYGNDFESLRYLMRFFDHSYSFAAPDLSRFVNFFFGTRRINLNLLASPTRDPVTFTTHMFQHIGSDLRQIEQCLELLHTIVTGWDKGCPLQLLYLLPLIIANKRGETAIFDALSNPSANREIVERSFLPRFWQITFSKRLHYDNSEEKVSVFALLDRLLVKLKGHFGEAIRGNDGDSMSQRWLTDQFYNELQAVQHGAYSESTKSIMIEYPRLVQQAGRLKSS